jgi:ferritin-like metal-binding protein YciE
MNATSLRELFVEELKDLYDAENQLVEALPKMAEASMSAELREAFEEHLEQTRNHAQRLEQVFQIAGEKPKKGDCKAMTGLIKEGNQLAKDIDQEEVRDAALISAAQRVEHYEISGYGTLRTWAGLLGLSDAQELLEETLQEEKDADEKLNEIAESANVEAGGTAAGTMRSRRPSEAA